jgi:glycosyltransferase involved in cell wall biosynthesis
MRCPTLADLPPIPPGRTGWPWTEDSPQLLDTVSDGAPWPRISIVTSSYNQGQFIEETIRSVLLQGYPNLEYIIIDGGSTDESAEVIRKYEPWLAYWVSEPDKGQADAINKGFAQATGSLIGWMNSDDLFTPSALCRLAEEHSQHPEKILAGPVIDFDERGYEKRIHQRGLTFENFVKFWQGNYKYHMPGIFYPRESIERVGDLDVGLRYLFDMDLMCRLLQVSEVEYLSHPLARFRLHPRSKTVAEKAGFLPEAIEISKRYWHLVEDVDESEFLERVSVQYAVRGMSMLYHGRLRGGIHSLSTSLRLDPLGVPRRAITRTAQQIRGRSNSKAKSI